MLHRIRSIPWVVWVLLVVIIAGIFVVWSAVAEAGHRAPAAETPAPTATVEASAEPEHNDEHEDHDAQGLNTESGMEFESCEVGLAPEDYATLKDRALTFEALWQNVDTQEKQEGIETFGTADYIVRNTVFVDPTLELTWYPLEIDLSRTSFSCKENLDGSVRVAITAVIRPYEDLNGTRTYLTEDWATMPIHTTDWVQENGTWLISHER